MMLPVDRVKVEVVEIDVVAAIRGGVVDDNHLVVGVVLGENGVEVALDAEIGVVFIARHDDTHWQLLLQSRYTEFFFESHPFSLVVLDGHLFLLLTVHKIVFDESDALRVSLRIDKICPLHDELPSLLPGCIVIENFIDPT